LCAINKEACNKTNCFFCPHAVDSVGVTGLPPAEDLERLARDYQGTLELGFREERFFPALTFPFNGMIIGWKIATTRRSGGTNPIITPWSFEGVEYKRGQQMETTECIISELPLNNFTVFIHESGPEPPGVPFNRSDILSVFMRPENNVRFVPYLYNGNLQTEVSASAGGVYSLFRNVQRPRDPTVRLERLNPDALLPLLSLELCED
jgi:hypothetical protein